MPAWGDIAKQQGIKYFLISFVDLFGTMRAKIVPASAIDTVARSEPDSPVSRSGTT
jgi:glutamine synthetase